MYRSNLSESGYNLNDDDSIAQADIKMAYVFESFPVRTENFIIRELSSIYAINQNISIYTFKNNFSDWTYIDCSEIASKINISVIKYSIISLLIIHCKIFLSSPVIFIKALFDSLSLYGYNIRRAL